MKHSQGGFMLAELVVIIGVIALVATATTMSVVQAVSGTERSNSHMIAVRHVQNAGYWISRDGQMAEEVSTENLTPPDFLVFRWTDWGYGDDSVYHSVTYSLENVSGGIGELRRTHQDSTGTDEQVLVANYIYYNPGDPGNTTEVTYESYVLTVKLVTMFGDVKETREYKVYTRPEF